MIKIQNFNDFITESNDAELIDKVSGISSVMNKVIAYNKRAMISSGVVANESFRAMYKYNQDIYFSSDERIAIKEMFSEFIPRIAYAMVNELNENGCDYDESILDELGINDELNEGIFSKALNAVVNGAKSVTDFRQRLCHRQEHRLDLF